MSEQGELAALIGERRAKALLLRRSGLTYKAIGEHIGASPARANQLVRGAEYLLRNPRLIDPDSMDSLGTRLCGLLRSKGYETKEQVREAVARGELRPRAGTGYWKESHRVVCSWLGVEVRPYVRSNAKVIAKYTAYLERHGYKVTPVDPPPVTA